MIVVVVMLVTLVDWVPAVAARIIGVCGSKKSWIWIWNASCDGLGQVTIAASCHTHGIDVAPPVAPKPVSSLNRSCVDIIIAVLLLCGTVLVASILADSCECCHDTMQQGY